MKRLLTLFLIFCSIVLNAQDITITGVIRDAQGPLPGVNIVIKGTTTGTITDFNGAYSLLAKKGDVFVFSSIGLVNQEVVISNQSVINLTMKENVEKLEEVVIVGYGVQKRASVTGSVASISSEKLEKIPTDNVSNMIGGRMPGVVARQTSGVPGDSGSEVYIRGVSTTGNSKPLILVDGVERNFENLDPSEIENITVLKDAASAAIYGVKGANGVILVTTKRGKSGDKMNVSYNGAVNFSTNTAFPEFLNAYDYAQWQNKAVVLDGQVPVYDEKRLEYIMKGNDPQGIFGQTDWMDLIFKPFALAQSHTVNISGGNDRAKYFVAGSYLDQGGIIERVNFDRYNLRSNIDLKINEYVDLKVDVSGRIERRRQPGVSAGSKDPTGSSENGGASMGYKNIVFYAISAKPTINATTPEGVLMGYSNPLVARDHSGFTNRDAKFVETSTALSVKIPGVKGLKVTGLLGYDFNNSLYKQLLLPYQQVTPKFETGMNGTPVELLAGLSPHYEGPNKLSDAESEFTRYTFQAIANYNRAFNKHDVGVDLVWEQSGAKSRGFGASKYMELTQIPDLNFGTDVVPNSVYGSHSQSGRAGVVARLNYAFDNRYMLQVSGRADWSPKFDEADRLGFFPAVSLGWRLSEESFLKDRFSALDNLKLRGSWGVLGNDAISDFIYLQTMNMSRNSAVVLNDIGRPSLYTTGVPNRDITWERTTTVNAGAEASFWKGLLSVEADVFYKVTSDILQSQGGIMPPSIGGNFSPIINGGTVDVRGVEVIISHRKKINDLTYNVSGNLTFAKNRYVKTDDSPNIPEYQKRVGQSLGAVLGYVSDGLYQTQEDLLYAPKLNESARLGDIKYKDLNGDGRITAEDRTWIARSQTPEIMFGLNLDLNYKWFDLSLFFQGAANNDIMLSGTYSALGFSNGTFFTQAFKWGANAPKYLVEGSWTPENTTAEFPRLTNAPNENNFLVSDFWKRDAAYLRLKNVQFGYNVPKNFSQKINLEDLRFYVSGSNLLTFSGLPYIDPEAPSVNNGYYPQQRVFSLGVNVTF